MGYAIAWEALGSLPDGLTNVCSHGHALPLGEHAQTFEEISFDANLQTALILLFRPAFHDCPCSLHENLYGQVFFARLSLTGNLAGF